MKRRRKRPASGGSTYEPITIAPGQAIARLHIELPELANFAPQDQRELDIFYIGAIKRLLAALIDAGRVERVKAIMILVETLAREGDAALRNAVAVGLLEHLPDLGAKRLEMVQQAMGPTTQNAYKDVLAYNDATRALQQPPRTARRRKA